MKKFYWQNAKLASKPASRSLYLSLCCLIFVGTTNLDYRSRLYNNEMGYFLNGEEVKDGLLEIFEELKQDSYLWGSPEWLEMRDKLRRTGTSKGGRAHRQRKTYDSLRNSGLKWQI